MYKILRTIFRITFLYSIFKKTNFMQTIFDDRYDPATVRFPEVRGVMESSIAGVHLIGDISGTPLLKNGINMGFEVVEALSEKMGEAASGGVLDFIIVGSGGSGLSAALRAKELGRSCIVLEQGYEIARTIQKFAKGKKIFAEPLSVPVKGALFLADSITREELLEHWEAQAADAKLDIRFGEQVTDIRQMDGILSVVSRKQEYRARRVILGIGKSGNPRKIGCEGDDLPKNSHFLADADRHKGESILIYGGGDVAMEAGIALADSNEVTIATIDRELVFPAKRNRDKILELERDGKIRLLLDTRVTQVTEETVELENMTSEEAQEIKNDRLFTMIGADLPLTFFKKIGLKLERTWDLKRRLYLLALFVVVYFIYAVDKGKFFPLVHGQEISSWLRQVTGFAGWDWYAALYTVVMVVFGSLTAMRWSKTAEERGWSTGKRRLLLLVDSMLLLLPPTLLFIFSRGHLGTAGVAASLGGTMVPLYIMLCLLAVLLNVFFWNGLRWDRIKLQGWRYGALLFVQILLFGLGSVYASGRYGPAVSKKWSSHAYKIVYNGPLSPNAVISPYVNARRALQQEMKNDLPGSETTASLLNSIAGKVFIFSLAFTLFLIPLLTIAAGKGFCSWVCGCGGLAETLGDRWRHYSPKGRKSIALELQGSVITVIFFLMIGWLFYRMLAVNGALDPRYSGTSGLFYAVYMAVVDWWLIGILPVALYPFFGGKVWCRYWCPLAKYMQWWSKLWRKLKIGRYSIRAKEGCITCGECSRYCQVGIDVQSFARNEETFDNRSSSCIACGICVTVCPMDVLKFQNRPAEDVQ